MFEQQKKVKIIIDGKGREKGEETEANERNRNGRVLGDIGK